MRKVLSFVLVLTLVLSSFSMAFAATPGGANLSDIAGNANADAIQVAYDLGIVTGNPDGTFLPEKAVNRAEFAAMITRALAIPDSALAGYTSTTFKDTAGYGWAVPYLAFAQSKGIMLGDGAGNVMPGRTITVNEAMTMALRAIGYTANSAMLVGAWPANYVSIAQNEELYDDVAADTTVNKASAAQIIYNLLTVQKVAVNTDGDTVFQTIRVDGDTLAANLLNTNLGCTAVADEILGTSFDYDNSLINITGKLGAFGTAYKNKDGDLVAFTVDSTALTGKVEDGKFKVGDTKYDLPGTSTISALFANSDAEGSTNGAVDVRIASYAAVNADGGKNVTINVDLSGKKIKEVYSVVAWSATEAKLADADVQEEINDDQELLGEEFPLDDNDDIEMKGFQLVGVASLDKIAEDDVVYVYTDNAGDIRKVAVGTETVEGVVDEAGSDYVTVGGKDYKFSSIAEVSVDDFDLDSEGTFYLDFEGKIFDFEGTTGTADTYAVVKAAYVDEDAYDSGKIKLYLSDDSTKTLYLADDLADIDHVTKSSIASVTNVAGVLKTTGAVIGYSLDKDGEIDTVDVTQANGSVEIQSTKTLKLGTASYTIDSNAVVFTFDAAKGIAGGDYDVAKLADMKKITTNGSIILNEDGKVGAILLPDTAVDSKSDDVYGVVNDWTRSKNGDDDAYRLTGLIAGSEFSKKSEDDAAKYKNAAGKFSVYAIAVDANDIITDIVDLAGTNAKATEKSGYVVLGAIVDSLVSNKSVIKDNAGNLWTVEDDVIVYEYDKNDKEFTKSSMTKIKAGYTVSMFDTKDDDADGVATIVIFHE